MSGRMRASGFINRGERGFQVAVAETDEQLKILTEAKSWQFMEADQDLDTFFMNEPEVALAEPFISWREK